MRLIFTGPTHGSHQTRYNCRRRKLIILAGNREYANRYAEGKYYASVSPQEMGQLQNMTV